MLQEPPLSPINIGMQRSEGDINSSSSPVKTLQEESVMKSQVTSEDTVTVGAGVKGEVGDAGVRIEVGESGEGNEKHEDDDVGKEDAEKMDLSEVPSVLTTSSEGEVAEGELAEEEVRTC